MNTSTVIRGRIWVIVALGVAVGAYMAMGCGSSGSGSSTSASDSGTTAASAGSLSTVPSVDISNYDSTTTASASVSAPEGEVSAAKSVGYKVAEIKPHQEGLSSRAACEYNAHKQEIIRHSQEAQLDRCYPEAMEKGKLITIPTGSYAYYAVTPPEERAEDRANKCNGIPADMATEKAKCLEAKEGPQSGEMRVRIGRFDNELRVNMCQAGVQVSSGAYAFVSGASGSTATIQAVNTRTFNGHTDKIRFNATARGLKAITDGIPTEWDATEGDLTANMAVSGGFGSGTNTYTYNPNTKVTTLAGYFSASFTEARNNAPTSFAGKVYSIADATGVGCSKYSFTGGPPPMMVKDMVPFNVSAANLGAFFQSLSLGLGIDVTANNYQTLKLCMNPDFNPDSPSLLVKPMVAANSNSSCPTVTHTGVECFSITNTQTTDPFGKRNKVEQTFKTVANTAVSYYTAVNAFDLGTITTDVGAFTHANDWDCAAGADGFSSLSFVNATGENLARMMTAMQSCNSLEQKARGNSGMGGHNCNGQDQSKTVGKMAESPTDSGKYGGKWVFTTNNCGLNNGVSSQLPTQLFAECKDTSSDLYCLPSSGACTVFNIQANPVNVASKAIKHGDFTMQTITFTMANNKATGGTIAYKNGPFDCTASFTVSQPNFTAATAPTTAAQFPKECVEKGLTDAAKCGSYCDPRTGHTCTPPS